MKDKPMLWREISETITGSPSLRRLDGLVRSGKRLTGVTGPCETGKALAIAGLFETRRRTVLWLVPGPDEAERQRDNLAALLGDAAVRLWACWDVIPGEQREPDVELVGSRMEALAALHGQGPVVVVGSARALLQGTLAPEQFAARQVRLTAGQRLDREALIETLSRSGYSRVPVISGYGEFSVRGSIVDVAGFGMADPVRLELDEADVIASLRSFSLVDQRSTRKIEHALVLPRSEAGDGAGSLLAHLPEDVLLCYDEAGEAHAEFESVEEEQRNYGPDPRFFPARPAGQGLARLQTVLLTSGAGFGLAEGPQPDDVVRVPAHPVEPFLSNLKLLAQRIDKLRQDGIAVRILADNEGQRQRLAEVLPEATRAQVQALDVAGLHGGVVWAEGGLCLITEREIFAREKRRRFRRFFQGGGAIRSLDALAAGDYMVHIDYGVCQYQGLVQLELGGGSTECLLLVFRDGDKVYVPIEHMKKVQRYSSEEGYAPALSKLGSGAWEETKSRVKKAAKDMAGELLAIYAARKSQPGFACSADHAWQKELEASFPYEETRDQLAAIAAIKSDMESDKPMDRLLCGDVGYGKTEVALRAAFKAVMDHKQVAILVPTTVLAEQHYQTFSERLAEYPVKVEMLSRFRTAADQRAVVGQAAAGAVDILIGTHRILQQDVAFKDLGLLVIDEEQRFGVGHKERIKKLCRSVDVLTMTATPIPRTLHMSLLGVRDISNIETPPRDRLAVLTEVLPWDERRIREAVLRELDRGGQVFFLHNKVQTIESVTALLGRMLPGVAMAYAHGQMAPRELERVMLAFAAGRFDLLVATTIIESGLDMPNVNTIVINRADTLGLAQLYQLRGRVGRSNKRAHACLLVPRGGAISEIAAKRLRVIEELSELGSGFKLALRDLEIRGAGNLLGGEQHGHMLSVGFELYCQLLEEAVRELKGLTAIPMLDVKLELDCGALIPPDYVDDPNERINLYRRLNRANRPEEVDALAEEMADRFGPPPPPARRLLAAALLRLAAASLAATRVTARGRTLQLWWPQGRPPSRQTVERLVQNVAEPLEFVTGEQFVITVALGGASDLGAMARRMFKA
ncbi:MAG: transcription-repair coupling factor [Candidatus Edwardsbacteria bacterium]|jgi:transcription-repair coupling factor (superfamily II helicase)|nr:transcription-repair coupling factor [Candidatus Edwardsbacteria bacterium]